MFTTTTISRRRFSQIVAATAATIPYLSELPVSAQRDTNFVFAEIAEPADLTPWIRGLGSFATSAIYENLVITRMTLNDDDTVTIEHVGVLAESWERTDELTWRFALRQGVTFSNGEVFDATSVKASWDILANAEMATERSAFPLLRAFQSCEIVDDYTIEIKTWVPDTEAIGYYLMLGFVVLPAGKLAEEGIDAFAEAPVGTGPYMFKEWKRGSHIDLERNPNYWNADFAQTYQDLTFIFRPEAAVRAQTIASGEADFAYNIGVEQGHTLPHYVVGGGFQSTSIRINNAIEPTNDLNLRRAINYAIDRSSICEAIFKGTATPIGFFAFQPVVLEAFPYDPEQATQLISDGGYAGTELELVYGEGRIPEEDQLAELYKAYLESVGLVINLRKVEPGQYNEIGGQEFAAQPALYMETTSSGNYGEIAGGLQDKYGSAGSGTFADPAFDARFEALAALEGETRLAEIQSIAEDLNELAPRAWIAGVQQVHGYAERIQPDLPLNSKILIGDLVN